MTARRYDDDPELVLAARAGDGGAFTTLFQRWFDPCVEVARRIVHDPETAAEVAQVLERLWGGPETLIVVSSDLSHYHDYATARRLDRETSRFIQDLSPVPLHGEQACGCRPVSGLLQAARDHGLQARLLDLRSSGDTAGPRDRVVGYGAYAFA